MLIREIVIIAIVVFCALAFGYKVYRSLKSDDTAWSHVKKEDRKKLILLGIVLAIVVVGGTYLVVNLIWYLQGLTR